MKAMKHLRSVIQTKSYPNRGFTQAVGLTYSLQGVFFHQINVLPLPVFGPLDTVLKRECSDKRFQII